MKVTALLVLALLLIVICQAKIRILSEKNMEHFAKDNSYWLIQISSNYCSTQMESAKNASSTNKNSSSSTTCSKDC